MMADLMKKAVVALALPLLMMAGANAQKYKNIVDRAAAVVGDELIMISDIEAEVQVQRTRGKGSDRNARCEILENMMQSKLFLIQAHIDSLTVNQDMVENSLSQHLDQVKTALGGDEQVEEYFRKPLNRLRKEWRKQFEDQSLIQQEQGEIVKKLPEISPYDVKRYIDTTAVDDLPVVPEKYQLSQICIYPDREAAAMVVKEKLLNLRERIINGEKFSTLARLYSEDPGSARKGGELGMASKSVFWPVFSDAAMALKPGTISQIVETPDGFHIIEVLEKKGDMFNARHILLKPQYTDEDREKAFARLDSLKTMIDTAGISFEMAARYFSEDPATRTNGGQMADPNTGSSYFVIDELKPQDYIAIRDLKPGDISEPVESLDNEGRDGNLVYKIIRLDKIVPSHTATFEKDYTVLRDIVQHSAQVKAIEGFIDEHIKTTHIVIDPVFADCEFSRKEWSEKLRK